MEPAIQLDTEPAIMVREPDATMQPTPQDNQLMSKHRVLSFSASLGDSITSSTRIRFSIHTPAASQQGAAFFSECEEIVAEQFVIVALAYQSAFLESRGETVGDLGDCPARHRIGKEIAVAADLLHDLAHLGRDGIRRAVELDRLGIAEPSHLPQRTSPLSETFHVALLP